MAVVVSGSPSSMTTFYPIAAPSMSSGGIVPTAIMTATSILPPTTSLFVVPTPPAPSMGSSSSSPTSLTTTISEPTSRLFPTDLSSASSSSSPSPSPASANAAARPRLLSGISIVVTVILLSILGL